MKGYREFGSLAAPITYEPVETAETIEWKETSELEAEGFRPY